VKSITLKEASFFSDIKVKITMRLGCREILSEGFVLCPLDYFILQF
jgi:hypothetical protein